MVLVTQRVSESTVKLKIRCPQCVKLYEVESEDIRSEAPLFQCISCQTRFGFEYPPADPANILCFEISNQPETLTAAKQQESVSAEPGGSEMKNCPKCGAMNGRKSKECYSCHVIFERLVGLPSDASLKAQPSLVRKWKMVLENFENQELHQNFIRSCHELDALRFAAMKYEEIKSAQGGDALCDQMIAKINSLMVVGLSQKASTKRIEDNPTRPSWLKYLFWSPYTISAMMILYGMINLGHRNLIGIGVALTCMSTGLIVMVRGKISLSDFVD